jgi:hypothetical protein
VVAGQEDDEELDVSGNTATNLVVLIVEKNRRKPKHEDN